MSVHYCVRITCDEPGCKGFCYAPGTADALEVGWAMLPHGWLCPTHSQAWLSEQTSEPTDEDLLA